MVPRQRRVQRAAHGSTSTSPLRTPRMSEGGDTRHSLSSQRCGGCGVAGRAHQVTCAVERDGYCAVQWRCVTKAADDQRKEKYSVPTTRWIYVNAYQPSLADTRNHIGMALYLYRYVLQFLNSRTFFTFVSNQLWHNLRPGLHSVKLPVA